MIVALLVALIFAASACADPGAPDGPPGQSQDSPPTNLVTVTNLDDSGPGSLRAALEGAPPADPTYVQFAGDVRGIVKLEKQITVAAGKFVLDGPGTGGISLSGGDAS
ncbi:MAG TPA: hypothetical protein VHO06_01990, partial [Polyangia bacterium]|nr:hypothetical protein [Polyangia bacterium]